MGIILVFVLDAIELLRKSSSEVVVMLCRTQRHCPQSLVEVLVCFGAASIKRSIMRRCMGVGQILTTQRNKGCVVLS